MLPCDILPLTKFPKPPLQAARVKRRVGPRKIVPREILAEPKLEAVPQGFLILHPQAAPEFYQLTHTYIATS